MKTYYMNSKPRVPGNWITIDPRMSIFIRISTNFRKIFYKTTMIVWSLHLYRKPILRLWKHSSSIVTFMEMHRSWPPCILNSSPKIVEIRKHSRLRYRTVKHSTFKTVWARQCFWKPYNIVRGNTNRCAQTLLTRLLRVVVSSLGWILWANLLA